MTSTLLDDLVRDAADRAPGAVAVVDGEHRATYAELWERAGRLACLLQGAGCVPGDRVALLQPKSLEAVVGILGALRAGCVYVPLDPTGPAPRLAKILGASASTILLVSGAAGRRTEEVLAELPAEARPRAARVDVASAEQVLAEGAGVPMSFTGADLAQAPLTVTPHGRRSEDAAHLLFTSGSTGAPKGVAVPHRSVRRFIDWANPNFGVTAGDRHSGHSPLFFDLSTYDLFGTFAAGAQLHLVPTEVNLLPHRLAGFIRDRALTQWFSVPSVLTHLAGFDAVRHGDFPALRRLLWCGEVLPTATLIHWMTRLPRVTFTNLYGPTETTVASSYYRVPEVPADPRSPIPIGSACGGEELLVLDGDLRPCPPDEEGDLYIRGEGLTLGYWRDPETTAKAFRELPSGRVYRTGDRARIGADGLVYFLGRADLQIKSRGYRIELGEIEAALALLPEVREGAVVALSSAGFEGTRIACAYVLRTPEAVTPAVLRARLARSLPSYMLPSEWRELAVLPRTGNGKLDRQAVATGFRGGES